MANRLFKKLRAWIESIPFDEHALKWSTIGNFLRSPLAKGAALVPVMGYVVLYSEQFQTFFNFPSLPSYAWFSPLQRSIFVYAGGIIILFNWISYFGGSRGDLRRFDKHLERYQNYLHRGGVFELGDAMNDYLSGIGSKKTRHDFHAYLEKFSVWLVNEHWIQLAHMMGKLARYDGDLNRRSEESQPETLNSGDSSPFLEWWKEVIEIARDDDSVSSIGSEKTLRKYEAMSFRKNTVADAVNGIANLGLQELHDVQIRAFTAGIVAHHFHLLNSTTPIARAFASVGIILGSALLLLPGLETFVRILMLPFQG